MIYRNYQAFADLCDPLRMFASSARSILGGWQFTSFAPPLKRMVAWYEQFSLLGFSHERPPFRIGPVIDHAGHPVAVLESIAAVTPFCNLVRFQQEGACGQPKVLLVAPMSGHFSTLLRDTVQTLVQDFDVYLTDWNNIRDVPLAAGEFDLDAFMAEIIHFLRYLGPAAHLIAVCQPTVACLAVASILAEDRDPCTPASLTLMAGPVDPRINPTKVNALATSRSIEWFEQRLIGTVPSQFAGSGRRVYPGFVQVAAFMSMNLDRHRKSFLDLFELRSAGQDEKADMIHQFYREYFSIMDLAAPFYLETVKKIFQEHQLPLGKLMFQGRPVRPAALRRTFLLTVEGERDDICGIGQTLAAQDLCSRIPASMKTHHLQAGAGHYGVFSGRKWTAQVYPIVRSVIENAS